MVTTIIALILAFFGVIFALGKGGFLIAGYNTNSTKDKAKYNERKLNSCYSVFCFVLALFVGIVGIVNPKDFTYTGLLFAIVYTILLYVVTETYCKNK